MTGARQRLLDFWEDVIRDFLAGRETRRRDPLSTWSSAYHGRGRGAVDLKAFPEPYVGSLTREPRAIFLGLNPGPVAPEFQYPGGYYVREIEERGSYHDWASTWPYLSELWQRHRGSNRHAKSRRRFMQDWYEDQSLGAEDMLTLELYPWHSQRVTGSVRVDPAIVREFILDPISEFAHPLVFAFGRDWFRFLGDQPDIEVVDSVGATGRRPYQGRVKGRSVLVGTTESGVTIIASMTRTFPSPPATDEVRYMREALAPDLPALGKSRVRS